MRMRVILTVTVVAIAIAAAAVGGIIWFANAFGDNVVATEPAESPLSGDLKAQLEEDPELSNLIKEGYQPTEVIAHKDDDPAIKLVHCGQACDDAPYSREYPAVLVSVEQLPAVGQVESIAVTKVTIVTPRHLDVRKQYGEVASCSETLFHTLSLTELRDIIAQLEGEDTSILPGDRLTAADYVESWRC